MYTCYMHVCMHMYTHTHMYTHASCGHVHIHNSNCNYLTCFDTTCCYAIYFSLVLWGLCCVGLRQRGTVRSSTHIIWYYCVLFSMYTIYDIIRLAFYIVAGTYCPLSNWFRRVCVPSRQTRVQSCVFVSVLCDLDSFWRVLTLGGVYICNPAY